MDDVPQDLGHEPPNHLRRVFGASAPMYAKIALDSSATKALVRFRGRFLEVSAAANFARLMSH